MASEQLLLSFFVLLWMFSSGNCILLFWMQSVSTDTRVCNKTLLRTKLLSGLLTPTFRIFGNWGKPLLFHL